MLKIGVSSCFFYPDLSRTTFGPKTLCYMERDMARFLTRPNVMPILIPDLEEEALIPFLKEMDAFVFQGGSDIAPQSYGEIPIQNGRWPGDLYRDQYELKIMNFAFKNNIPILGICRGFQLLNVFFKGTLYQDIPSEIKSDILHRDALIYDKVSHEATIETGHLKKIYPSYSKIKVNSVHHQGVKKLGEGLEVEARSVGDNMVEAFSYNRDQKFILGVQWHPEFSLSLKNEVVDPVPLYDYFLNKVKEKKSC